MLLLYFKHYYVICNQIKYFKEITTLNYSKLKSISKGI
jgi:hypothetical protein